VATWQPRAGQSVDADEVRDRGCGGPRRSNSYGAKHGGEPDLERARGNNA